MSAHCVTRTLAGLAALALTGGLAACTAAGATQSTPAHVLDLTAADYSYQMPTMAPLQAGLESIRLRNAGTQPHQATVIRLHDGVTYDQFTAALHQGEGPALALIDFEGGVNTIDPGATATAYSKLTAGNYAVLCFVQGPDGVPHLAKGMVMPFQVTGSSRRPARTPETEGTVGLHSYGFNLPPEFGHGTYAVTNTADEPHEFSILRVAPGKTADDVMSFLMAKTPSGPPPFTDAGGVAAISPGVTAYGVVNLQPGNYVALCFVPDDQAPHLPHFMMGMFQPFTVN